MCLDDHRSKETGSFNELALKHETSTFAFLDWDPQRAWVADAETGQSMQRGPRNP
jgi:hypothetical protein